MAVVAFFGFLAISFASCTKDLEDRVDKVEKDVAQLFTDVAKFGETLKALSEKPDLTMSVAQDEAGKVTITTKNPTNSIEFNGADGKGSVVSIQRNTPEDGKTSILIEGDVNSPYVFTTDVAIPTNVNGIVFVSSKGVDNSDRITLFETKSFSFNIYLNTNDGKPVTALNEDSFTIVEPKTRAAESEIINSDFYTISKVEQVETTNEYRITVATTSIGETTPWKNLRLRLNNPAQTISETLFVDVASVPDFNSIKYSLATPTSFEVFTGAAVADFKSDIVYVVDGVIQPKVRNVEVNILDDGLLLKSSGEFVSPFTATVYEYKTATLPAIHTKVNFSEAEVTAYDATVAAWVAANSDVKVSTTLATVSIDEVSTYYNIALDAAKVAGEVANNETKKFFIVLGGKSFSTNGLYARATAKYEITRRAAITMDPVTINTVVANEASATALYSFEQIYKDKTYAALTGESTPTTATSANVKVFNENGEIVLTTPALNKTTQLSLNPQNYLIYNINNLDVSKLASGVYTVELALEYKAGMFINFVQQVTISRPKIVPTLKAAVDAKLGWVKTGTDYVLNSIKPLNDATTGLGVIAPLVQNTADFAGVMTITGTGTGTPAFVSGTNYKVFYRLYTPGAVAGTKVYIDGQVDYKAYLYATTPVTAYTAVKEVADLTIPGLTAANILMDTKYFVDAVVVYQSGIKVEFKDICTYTYATTPITSFMDVAGPSAVVSKDLTRTYNLGETANTLFDFSYIKDAQKYFFLGDAAKFTANWDISTTVPFLSYNRSLKAMKYEIEELSPADQAKVVKADGTAADAATVSLIQFGTAQSIADVKTATRTAATLSWATLNGNATKLSGAVTQKIKISATDVWDREVVRYVVVTINPAVVPVP